MLRKRVGTWAVLVVSTGAMGALTGLGASGCSSSSSSTSPGIDSGTDSHTVTKTDAGKDSGKDSGGGGDGSTNHDGATDATGGGPPTARFIVPASGLPNLLDVPFPTDLYLANGLVSSSIPGVDSVITNNPTFITNELGKLNGFSRVAQSIFWVDDPSASDGIATLDPSSLPTSEAECVADGSSVFLLDLSATGAAARMPCRAAFHDDRTVGTGGYRPALAVGPGRGYVLKEGHQYATVVTSRVKTTSGKNIGASADFTGLSAAMTKSSVYSTALTTVKTILGTALGTDTVVDLAVFTTNSENKVLLQMRTNLESVTLPTLAWDSASLAPMGATKFAALVDGELPTGFTASLDDYLGTSTGPTLGDGGVQDPNTDLPVRAHDQIAAIGTAVFQAENYLSPAQGYSVLNGATFSYDSSGNVIPDPTTPKVPIWITFFVPKSEMPANGYPIVIVQHGLGESRADEAFNLANTFAAAGWMVAAIDSVTFGARAPEPQYQVDKVNNFASAGGSYAGPDGLADAIGNPPSTNGLDDIFGTLQNIGAIRDQFRQAEIDTSQLARLLHASLALPQLKTGATVPTIDGSKIAYFGNSLGGIQGAAAAAIEPYISNWVLNVAGGGLLLELADHSPRVAADLAFAGLNFGGGTDRLTESHPMINFLQTAVDPGDSLNFAPLAVLAPATVNGTVLAPKNILQISVVYDEFVPNESNESLARAFGMHLATPNVGTNSGVSTLGMVKDPTTIPDRLPLPDQNPDDAGLIHDTPVTGTTAVLVQTMPGIHGGDFQQGAATHDFAIPYNQFDSGTPFVTLGKGTASADPPFSINCSYQQLQAMAVRFLSDGFAGKTPNVAGFKAPIRDFDGDGVDDSVDSDPNNPNVH